MIQKIKFTGKDKAEFYPVLKRRVEAYFKEKGSDSAEKYFSKNSQIAYRWNERG